MRRIISINLLPKYWFLDDIFLFPESGRMSVFSSVSEIVFTMSLFMSRDITTVQSRKASTRVDDHRQRPCSHHENGRPGTLRQRRC